MEFFFDDVVENIELNIFEGDQVTAGGHLLDKNLKIHLFMESPILLKPLNKINILTEDYEIAL